MDAYVVYTVEKTFSHDRSSGQYFFDIYDAFNYLDKYLILLNHERVSDEEWEIFFEDLALVIELQDIDLHIEQIYIRKKWED